LTRTPSQPSGTLYFGDNLDILSRRIPDDSVDFLYRSGPLVRQEV
jgi:hypothetical protein